MSKEFYTLGIDIGSTTVKVAILDNAHNLLFSDYRRHYANIRETLATLLQDAYAKLGNITLHPMITGSGGLTLANHLGVPFVQEVIAVSTSLQELAPKTDVAIELGGEDAKIIYSIYNDDFKKPFKKEFANKLKMDGAKDNDLKGIKSETNFVELTKLAIDFADGVIQGSETINQEILDYIESLLNTLEDEQE